VAATVGQPFSPSSFSCFFSFAASLHCLRSMWKVEGTVHTGWAHAFGPGSVQPTDLGRVRPISKNNY
jgi:hypothetical protein